MISWSYIAGFFDGEGSIAHNGKGYRITIPQTSAQVLQRIRQFTKVGKVIALARRQPHWKDNWVYYVAKQAEVQTWLQRALPHLIVKRALTQHVLKELVRIVPRQEQRTKLASWHKREVRRLRRAGLPYRAIGKQLGIDWGYARRLYLKTNS